MNHIVRKKNDGYLIVEVLKDYRGINDGKSHMGLWYKRKICLLNKKELHL